MGFGKVTYNLPRAGISVCGAGDRMCKLVSIPGIAFVLRLNNTFALDCMEMRLRKRPLLLADSGRLIRGPASSNRYYRVQDTEKLSSLSHGDFPDVALYFFSSLPINMIVVLCTSILLSIFLGYKILDLVILDDFVNSCSTFKYTLYRLIYTESSS